MVSDALARQQNIKASLLVAKAYLGHQAKYKK